MIQGLGKAAQESGANSEVLIKAIAKMEAAIGNDSKAIKEMGLSLPQLKNSSPEEMLQTVSTRLLSMTDVTERNAAAQKLLGRAYMDVLPALEQYASSADRYVNLSNAQIAAGKDMDDALDAIGTAWKELGQQIGEALNTPEVREALRSLASSIREMALSVKWQRTDSRIFRVYRYRRAECSEVVCLSWRCDGGHEGADGFAIVHLIASRLEDHSTLLGQLTAATRDFH